MEQEDKTTTLKIRWYYFIKTNLGYSTQLKQDAYLVDFVMFTIVVPNVQLIKV